MMPRLSFTVLGQPVPKGATRPMPIRRKRPDGSWEVIGSRLIDDSRSRPWAALIKDAAAQALRQQQADARVLFPAGTPVRLTVTFWMPRPLSLPKRRPVAPVVRPDTSKLLRVVEDALMGVAYHDDSQLVEVVARKCYTAPNGHPRTDLVVQALAPIDEWPWTDSMATVADVTGPEPSSLFAAQEA